MQAIIPMAKLYERPVPAEAKVRHVDRVAASASFQRAAQLRKLLRWLAERSMSSAEPPTEHEVGMAVLGRADFDPQTDSLVRKEMSRLREKLNRYYLNEGANDELRIRSGGGYRLTFDWAARVPRPMPAAERPCVVILPLRHGAGLESESLDVLERLPLRAGQTGRIDLVSTMTALSYAGKRVDVRTVAVETGANCVVEGSLRRKARGLELLLSLVDGRTGIVRGAPRTFEGSMDEIVDKAGEWLGRGPS
ncbi:MAG: hypothetical protein R2729_29610 [Bryobacteraceae bacterium]